MKLTSKFFLINGIIRDDNVSDAVDWRKLGFQYYCISSSLRPPERYFYF